MSEPLHNNTKRDKIPEKIIKLSLQTPYCSMYCLATEHTENKKAELLQSGPRDAPYMGALKIFRCP